MSGLELDLYCQECDEVTMDALASLMDLHPDMIRSFVELGIIRPLRQQDNLMIFNASAIVRLRACSRLRRAFGINMAGAAVVLDLLDKVCELQRENQILRGKL